MERGCSKFEGTPTDQLQLVVTYLRAMEIRYVLCQVRQAGTCRQCHLGWCTHCQQEKGECDVCSVPITPTTNPGEGGAKSCAQRLQVKGRKRAEVVSVNMHLLGESFVEKVSDVRRRGTVDGQAAAPGESLEFLTHVRGWKSEAWRQRRDTLLQLNDIGLRVALTGASGADIFFIPEIHFAGETPELDDEGWWYQVQAVIWCRECRKCRVRKEQEGFQRNEWNKEQLAICTRCVSGTDPKRASARTTRKVSKRITTTPNPRARPPRAAQE